MRRIVLTGVPPFEVQDLAGPLEVFSQCDYEIELVSPERDGSTAINRGLRVTGDTDFRKFDRPIDTLWVVGGPEAPSGPYDPAYLRWLKEMASNARRVGASCLGTFVLAASGALEGRRAVTHWQWCDHLAERYPHVELVRSSIFVKDGHIYTSAGITTGIDLALLFVEEVRPTQGLRDRAMARSFRPADWELLAGQQAARAAVRLGQALRRIRELDLRAPRRGHQRRAYGRQRAHELAPVYARLSRREGHDASALRRACARRGGT